MLKTASQQQGKQPYRLTMLTVFKRTQRRAKTRIMRLNFVNLVNFVVKLRLKSFVVKTANLYFRLYRNRVVQRLKCEKGEKGKYDL